MRRLDRFKRVDRFVQVKGGSSGWCRLDRFKEVEAVREVKAVRHTEAGLGGLSG